MNKQEQLAEQIAEKHLGKKNFQYYGTLQKQGVIAAIVEAMGVQQVNTCEHRWQFDEEIEGAKYCKECGKIIEAPAKAVEAMPYTEDDRHWYALKDLMVAAMEKNLTPEDWVNVCKGLGYNVSRAAKEAMDSLPAQKGNNYVSSNSNTDDTSLASHSFTDGSSIEQLIKWIDKRCEIEFYEAGESYDEEIHAIKSGKLKALHEVKDYLLNADNQNTPTE
jgi:hypothetical protein